MDVTVMVACCMQRHIDALGHWNPAVGERRCMRQAEVMVRRSFGNEEFPLLGPGAIRWTDGMSGDE